MKNKKYSILFYSLVILIMITFSMKIANFVYPQAFYDMAYSNFIFQKKMLKGLKKKKMNPEMLIIGDMSAASMTMSTLMDSSVTLGLERATPIEMYYVFQDYLKEFSPRCLIINYSYFRDNYKDIFKMYASTGLYNLDRYDEINRKFLEYKNEKFAIEYKDFIKSYLNFDEYSINRMKKIFNRDELEKNKFRSYRMEEDILSYNGNYFVTANEKRTERINSVLSSRFFPDAFYDNYLEEILHLALKKNMKVYFLESPLNTNLKRNNYINSRNNHLGRLVLGVSGALYLPTNEYFNDDKLVNPLVLSRKGAAIFTNKILKKIDCK